MPSMDTEKPSASEVIDALGGTAAVARLCEVRMPSVSEWRRSGIPAARLMYLRVIRPDAFGEQPHADAFDEQSPMRAAG